MSAFWYGLLADAIVILHLGFVMLVLLGGCLALRWRRAPWIHLPAATWAAFVELAGWTCPLTPLENRLRDLGSGGAYQGDFVQHYLLPVLYPAGLTRTVQIGLGLAVIAVNLAVYCLVQHRRR